MCTVQILEGNCLETLATLPDASVDCVVTSPPYWGLRDYGIAPTPWPAIDYAPMAGLPVISVRPQDAVLGLEATVEDFIGHMVLVFAQVWRVLKADGTCWVNMGDCHVQSGSGRQGKSGQRSDRRHTQERTGPKSPLPLKNLIGQPWRVAFALQAQGWRLRQDIIWHKRNPTPESCKDRCTKAHEYLFLLSKSERYWWDKSAMQEPLSGTAHPRGSRKVAGWDSGPGAHDRIAFATAAGAGAVGRAKGVNPKAALNARGSRQNASFSAAISGHPDDPQYSAPYEGQATKDYASALAQDPSEVKRRIVEGVRAGRITGKNKRSVWSLVNQPYKGAHFATFPTALVRPCIRAGCRPGGVVLDPFGGSGTTAQVALEEHRSAILCELGPHNVEQIRARLSRTTIGLPLVA